MGMYDTIHLSCPVCNERIEEQSKGSNHANMRIFHQDSVPLDVADYVTEQVVECSNGHKSEISALPNRVRLVLKKVDNTGEFEYD